VFLVFKETNLTAGIPIAKINLVEETPDGTYVWVEGRSHPLVVTTSCMDILASIERLMYNEEEDSEHN